jgi:hypothetical protein
MTALTGDHVMVIVIFMDNCWRCEGKGYTSYGYNCQECRGRGFDLPPTSRIFVEVEEVEQALRRWERTRLRGVRYDQVIIDEPDADWLIKVAPPEPAPTEYKGGCALMAAILVAYADDVVQRFAALELV